MDPDIEKRYGYPPTASIEETLGATSGAQEIGGAVEQTTAHPTQKVWAFIASGTTLTSLFSALQDYGVFVKPNTQALATVILSFVAAYFTKDKS